MQSALAMMTPARSVASTLLAAAVAVAVMSAASASAGADFNMAIAPLELLETHPLCSGNGKIAYRVAFEAKQIKARFGVLGSEKPGFCSVTVRRGGKSERMPVNCPDNKTPAMDDVRVAQLPEAVDISGSLVGCLGMDTNVFVEGYWKITADTPLGRVENSGDLAEPSLSIGFAGPRISTQNQTFLGGDQPTIALVFDKVKATFLKPTEQQFSLSTYLAISAQTHIQEMCSTASSDCFDLPLTASMITWAFKGRQFYDVVRYVDGD